MLHKLRDVSPECDLQLKIESLPIEKTKKHTKNKPQNLQEIIDLFFFNQKGVCYFFPFI